MATGISTASIAVQSSQPTARRSLFELLGGYMLILAVIWTPRPWQARIYLIAALFIVWATLRSWPGLDVMGWRRANLLRSAGIILAAATVSAVAVACAARIGTLHTPPTAALFVQRFVGYIIFACIQQFLLQNFFLWRLLQIGLTQRNAVLTAAAIFAVAHLPSPILTCLTFIWGVAATAWFLRYRSLYSLAVAHMILGITVAICIPGPTIRNMRVGLGYLTYRAPHSHHLSH